ncbi:MAG: NAD(P)H-quinone oxidoreductase [Brachymonas sp.]|nr:NAD(P)H-quinone oxidoreductase [Brachymonas sp.]
MQAIAIREPGGPEVLVPTQVAVPQPGTGEVLIRVAASGVNRPDVVQRKGHYPPPPGASPLPGLEVAGHIVAGDAHAMQEAGLQIGDAVCALLAGGGYAEYATAHASHCLPVPKGWSLTQAASLPETFFTVWSNVFGLADLQAGQTLLVHGGSSGIGTAAIQLAKAAGAQVIVTAGSAEKCEACLALGADHAINYREQDFVEQVKTITQKRGVDVVLDMVAGSYVARNVECLATEGKLIIIAVQGGKDAAFNAVTVLMRRLRIIGSTLRSQPVDVKAEIAHGLRKNAWPWIEAGKIRPVIHATFPAAQAAQAHALMESGQHIGKIVLTWGDDR